jgi:lipoprotein-anchoring transpeptidase ErfK/SrfK
VSRHHVTAALRFVPVRSQLVAVPGAIFVAMGAACAVDSPSSGVDQEAVVEDLNRHDEAGLLPGASWIATATVPEVPVYPAPEVSEPSHHLPSVDANGTPLVFLVDGKNAEGPWVPVNLPVRPNGTKGWVREDVVTISQTQYRIRVSLGERRMDVTENDRVVLTTPVGVGKDATPTPGGTYYIKELLQPPNPNTVYGPYVFGLSGFSDVIMSFDGMGEGVIGIHGNNDPTSIGNSVSSGCIRVPNDVITQMTTFLPLGTPVDIVA